MWKRAFVATTVALGGTVDDALAALPAREDEAPETMRIVGVGTLDQLVAGLRAKTRPERAAALAAALRDILVSTEGLALR